MHVYGGHGMVRASIRDPYITRHGDKRMLGEQIDRLQAPPLGPGVPGFHGE
jgi:choline-sulfatase